MLVVFLFCKKWEFFDISMKYYKYIYYFIFKMNFVTIFVAKN